jgi:hypothetical protein
MLMIGMIRKILLLVFFTCLLANTADSQDKKNINKLDSSRLAEKSNTAQLIFNDIEAGINTSNVSQFAKFLDSQTYFSLSNGISGYYSANQAYYVLEDYLKLYKIISFRLKNVKAGSDNPYATGEYYYELKGKKDTAQVYISLKFTGNSWKITQITIN